MEANKGDWENPPDHSQEIPDQLENQAEVLFSGSVMAGEESTARLWNPYPLRWFDPSLSHHQFLNF